MLYSLDLEKVSRKLLRRTSTFAHALHSQHPDLFASYGSNIDFDDKFREKRVGSGKTICLRSKKDSVHWFKVIPGSQSTNSPTKLHDSKKYINLLEMTPVCQRLLSPPQRREFEYQLFVCNYIQRKLMSRKKSSSVAKSPLQDINEVAEDNTGVRAYCFGHKPRAAAVPGGKIKPL